jgi:hypothetical protein
METISVNKTACMVSSGKNCTCIRGQTRKVDFVETQLRSFVYEKVCAPMLSFCLIPCTLNIFSQFNF